jgi:5'-methylthioadenosine phosphorylase
MKIGIIGGSGLDDPQLVEDYEEKEVKTPYGRPSSKITCGKISGVEVCILARHGKNHEISPSKINYRANIYALKLLGCTHILASSAVGSLREQIKPGDLVFLNQFIDFTKLRKNTFYDQYGDVRHPSMPEPYSDELRKILINECRELGFEFHEKATIVVVEGPRFSTKAESFMFRDFADVIGMTSFPEVALANELEIPYATIAMSTDYDCWKEDEEPVAWEMILQRMKENADKVKNLLLRVIPKIANKDEKLIKSRIIDLPDYPKPGVVFRDITPLLKDPQAMKRVVDILYQRYKDKEINAIAAIESRGFILGGVLADKLGIGLVPIRKPGKLPRETISEEYGLEYGTDKVEIHKDAIKPGDKVLLVDDLLATSGTAMASCELIQKLGGKIEEIVSIIELEYLEGRKKLEDKGLKVFSIVKYEDDG